MDVRDLLYEEKIHMEYRDIEPGQRELVEQIRAKYGHCLLAHSFCTLLLWKETLKLSIHLEDDFYVVKYGIQGNNAYFFPCGNEEKQKDFIKAHIGEKEFKLYYLRKQDKELIEMYYPDTLHAEYDRGGCEYIFDKQRHISLRGKDYAKIRYEENHLNAHYRMRSEPLTPQLFGEALHILESWKLTNSRNDGIGFDDYAVAQNALLYFTEMDFIGNIVYVDDSPYAFSVGGAVTKDTFGIQVAKMGVPVSGLMFYLLRKCFELVPEQYVYINGDDDMDIEGIRIHKRKMRPCGMNEVWKAGCFGGCF